VERPLRLDFQASPERIERIEKESSFLKLAISRKRGEAKVQAEEEGRKLQEGIRKLLAQLPNKLFLTQPSFEKVLNRVADEIGFKLSAPVKKIILSALGERNCEASICLDMDGQSLPDPSLRDTESVPLSDSVEDFFAREVLVHVPDAWIDTNRRDPQDGKVGLVGYEINFNKYFYEYRPPRPLDQIQADIQEVEDEIIAMLRGKVSENVGK
jgi:type I restriction enzyme M protein